MEDSKKPHDKHATDARWRKALRRYAGEARSARVMHASANGSFVCDLPDIELSPVYVTASGETADSMSAGGRRLLASDDFEPLAPDAVADWLWDACLNQALAYAENHELSVVRLGCDLMDGDGETIAEVPRCRVPVDAGVTEPDGAEPDPGTVTAYALLRRADAREKGLHSLVMESHKREAGTLKVANKTIETATVFQTSMVSGMETFLNKIAEDAMLKIQESAEAEKPSQMDPEVQREIINLVGSFLSKPAAATAPAPPQNKTPPAWTKEKCEALSSAINSAVRGASASEDSEILEFDPLLHAWLARISARAPGRDLDPGEAARLAAYVQSRADDMRDALSLPLLLKLKALADAVL